MKKRDKNDEKKNVVDIHKFRHKDSILSMSLRSSSTNVYILTLILQRRTYLILNFITGQGQGQ